MEDKHYVYILRCKDESLYTGYTNNLEARLKKHESGKGAKYTRGRGPFIVEAVKSYPTKTKALQEEYRIKRMSRHQKERWVVEEKEGGRLNEGTEKL